MKIKNCSVFVALQIASLIASAAVQSTVGVHGAADTEDIFCSDQSLTGGIATSCGAASDLTSGHGTASAVAESGHLAVFASAKSNTTYRESSLGFGVVHADSSISFADQLIINGYPPGTFGTLTFSVYLQSYGYGALSAGGTYSLAAGGHDLQAFVSINQSSHLISHSYFERRDAREDGVTITKSLANSVDGSAVANSLGYHEFTVEVPLATTFTLALELRGHAFAQSYINAASIWSLDATHSFDWAGISKLTVGGLSVPIDIESESGVDWTKSYAPVPEPKTYAMVIAGLLVAAFSIHRRRDDATFEEVQVAPHAEGVLFKATT
jgi:hypothetical protein